MPRAVKINKVCVSTLPPYPPYSSSVYRLLSCSIQRLLCISSIQEPCSDHSPLIYLTNEKYFVRPSRPSKISLVSTCSTVASVVCIFSLHCILAILCMMQAATKCDMPFSDSMLRACDNFHVESPLTTGSRGQQRTLLSQTNLLQFLARRLCSLQG